MRAICSLQGLRKKNESIKNAGTPASVTPANPPSLSTSSCPTARDRVAKAKTRIFETFLVGYWERLGVHLHTVYATWNG